MLVYLLLLACIGAAAYLLYKKYFSNKKPPNCVPRTDITDPSNYNSVCNSITTKDKCNTGIKNFGKICEWKENNKKKE